MKELLLFILVLIFTVVPYLGVARDNYKKMKEDEHFEKNKPKSTQHTHF